MKRFSFLIKDEIGSISTMAIILTFVFVGLMAIVIDLGHLHTVQNELRDAADACALRGARAFVPDNVPPPGSGGLVPAETGDVMKQRATTEAAATISANKSDNVALQDLPVGEIQVGIWYFDPTENPNPTDQLNAWNWPPPSSEWGKYIGPGIRLPVKRDAAHNAGPVNTTMANIFGIATVPVRDNATAALSAMGGPVPGSPEMPFGTWDDQLAGKTAPFDFHGIMRNDNTDNLGWTNLDPNNTNPNLSQIKKLLNDPTGASTPDCPTDSEVGIQNGVGASGLKAMVDNKTRFGLIETPPGSKVYVPTGNNAAGVPYANIVYMMPVFSDNGSGDKFNHSAVVGAVPVTITKVGNSPYNFIDLKIDGGNYIAPGHGGGRFYGILSTDPKLVQ